jgi:lipopolysaccharide transport system ATP-binding protein
VRDALLGRRSGIVRGGVKVAVDGVSLTIGSGERVGIVGRNGAGKSSLLHMLAGVAQPSAGDLQVDGKVTSILTLGVGLREEASGRENVYLDAEVQGTDRASVDELMSEIADFAELGEFFDRPVRTYSTGMKARLAFAMISHLAPEILLIDEALSVGDAAFSAKASRRIREICNRGSVVIVVSHSMRSICEICNRCLWMEDGRIALDGTPEKVTAAYVQSVREADEKVMLAKFRNHVGTQSLADGCDISVLDTAQAGTGLPRSVLPSEQAWSVHVAGAALKAGARNDLGLDIERLDGLSMLRESTALDPEAGDAAGRFAVTATIPPALAHGIYRVTATLSIDAAPAARRSTIVELTADAPPTGGRPALLYPYTLTGAKLT